MLVQPCLIFFCISALVNSVTFACLPSLLGKAPTQNHGYHVSVRFEGEHQCSGSIINQRYILTTYMCLQPRSSDNITIVAGTNSVETGGDSYEIEEVISKYSFHEDIALLRTKKEIIFHDDIRSIPIASHNNYTDDYELSITGWEKPFMVGEKRQSDMLQEISARRYDRKACIEDTSFNGIEYLCIYDPNGREICNADQGGAIVADGHQIGIYIGERLCYNASVPHKHTLVYPHLEWIRNNTKLENDKTLSPTPTSTTPLTSSPASSTVSPTSVKDEVSEHDAPAGAYPYHVSIRHNDQHVCSGSIINERYILTSINCIMRYSTWSLKVMVGISSLNETGAIHQVDDVHYYRHKNYDIAILHLVTDITFNHRVKSIPIVMSSKAYKDSEKIILTGWQRKDSCGSSSDKLQHIPLYIFGAGKCEQMIPFLDPLYMCSIEKDSHTCNIDYGAPIVRDGIQIALNPFGVGCGGKFEPHLHLPLYKVASWIKRHSRL